MKTVVGSFTPDRWISRVGYFSEQLSVKPTETLTFPVTHPVRMAPPTTAHDGEAETIGREVISDCLIAAPLKKQEWEPCDVTAIEHKKPEGMYD